MEKYVIYKTINDDFELFINISDYTEGKNEAGEFMTVSIKDILHKRSSLKDRFETSKGKDGVYWRLKYADGSYSFWTNKLKMLKIRDSSLEIFEFPDNESALLWYKLNC
jgi:hypothetical protein